MTALASNAPTGPAALEQLQRRLAEVRDQIGQIIVGQPALVEGVLIALVAGGHALLEGVPGLGKTLLIRSLAAATSLEFSRIQFTPDLMPADVVGTSILVDSPAGGGRELRYQPGPIFAHIVLADEINRATPKTQSALLEAMAERQVTAAGKTRPLPEPFFVLATQNPLEQEGTYPLPEAQLDRFLFKLRVPFPDEDELVAILERTTGPGEAMIRPVLDGPSLLELQRWVRAMPVRPSLVRYVAKLIQATHPDHPSAPASVQRLARYGASPRGAQAVLSTAKVLTAIRGREVPSAEEIRAVVPDALRHRVILSFEGEAEGIQTDALLADVVASVPVPT